MFSRHEGIPYWPESWFTHGPSWDPSWDPIPTWRIIPFSFSGWDHPQFFSALLPHLSMVPKLHHPLSSRVGIASSTGFLQIAPKSPVEICWDTDVYVILTGLYRIHIYSIDVCVRLCVHDIYIYTMYVYNVHVFMYIYQHSIFRLEARALLPKWSWKNRS